MYNTLVFNQDPTVKLTTVLLNPNAPVCPKRALREKTDKTQLIKNPVVGGIPITQDQAIELRQTVFGSCCAPLRSDWLRTGFLFRDAEEEFGYGLSAPVNGTRGLLTVVQAHLVKYFLFNKSKLDKDTSPDKLLKPTRQRQIDALWTAIADIIWTVGEKQKAVVCLPAETQIVYHSSSYFTDGITEYLHLFEFTSLEDLQIFIKRYIYIFLNDPSPASLLLLYCAVLTRGMSKIRTDLEEKAYLVAAAEDDSNCIITLLLTGRATPYLHNGVVYVGDEDHYAKPQWGIMCRSQVGFLLYDESSDPKNLEECKQPGSRLKTPSLPVWVVNCTGHYGVLFNTNSELLRNYHAERRFELNYYTVCGAYSLLSVDTRQEHQERTKSEKTSKTVSAASLEKLVHTKWADAMINWSEMTTLD